MLSHFLNSSISLISIPPSAPITIPIFLHFPSIIVSTIFFIDILSSNIFSYNTNTISSFSISFKVCFILPIILISGIFTLLDCFDDDSSIFLNLSSFFVISFSLNLTTFLLSGITFILSTPSSVVFSKKYSNLSPFIAA